MQINTFRNRLLISFLLAIPSYAFLALIRGSAFSEISLYAYIYYATSVFLILIFLFEIHTQKSSYFNDILPWKNKAVYRLLAESVFTLLITPLIVSSFIIILYEVMFNMRILIGGIPELIEYNLFALAFSFLMAGFVNADILINEWKRSLIYTEVIEKENMRAHLNALQSQVSPHFLFNNFNVLNSLIEEDPKLAQQYLESLSKIFRYVLKRKDKEVVSLREELDFIDEYIFLLKIRFGNRLQYKVDADSKKKYQIPPVTLQILIENAVKHNEISSEHPLKINIQSCDDGYLKVSNNLRRRQGETTGTGTGLENIIERYSYLTDKQVSINQTDNEFNIRVPLLEF